MNLLAIECTQAALSIAVQTSDTVVERTSGEWRNTAERILPLIDVTLSDAGLPSTSLDAVVLSAGPGSFTALRIGMSTAKGLCFALDKPFIMVPTLHALGRSALKHTDSKIIVPVVHSKADEFYYAIGNREAWAATELHGIENGYAALGEISALIDSCGSTTLAGRGLSRWQDEIVKARNALITVSEASYFNAASLLELGSNKFYAGQFEDLASAEPLYLKNFEAKLSKKQPYLKSVYNSDGTKNDSGSI